MSWLLDPKYAELNQQIAAWLLAAGLLGAALFWNHRARQSATVQRAVLGALVAVTLFAACANFYQTRGRPWIHRWDLFHTVVGAKYFPELGYNHLYDCAYTFASPETPWAFRRVTKIRDLRTLDYVRAEKVLKRNTCEQRFSPERKRAFTDDVHAFGRLGLQERWHEAFKDKGYNGTPFYTLLVRAVVGNMAITQEHLLGLALIDIVLLALAIAVVVRTRGLIVACLVLATLATCFPGRFVHMGGSLLRFDYVAALIMGFCALDAKRPATAGVLMAYAALVRMFPVLFAVGVGLAFAAQAIEQRKVSREMVRFYAGGLLGLLVLGGATFVFGRGAHDWPLWWHEVREHTRLSAPFRVGFKHMFMMDGNLSGEDGFVPYEEKAEHLRDRYALYVACGLALIAPLLTRARRWDVTTYGVFFGTVTFFVGLVATRYYYAVLAVLPLIDWRAVGARTYALIIGLLSLGTAVTYAIASAVRHSAFLNNTVVTSDLTLLAAALAGWCVWLTWIERRVRREGASSEPARSEPGAVESSKAAPR